MAHDWFGAHNTIDLWSILRVPLNTPKQLNRQKTQLKTVSFLKQFDSCPKWPFINFQNKSWSLSSRKIFPPLNTHKLKTYKICTLKCMWVRKLLSISSRDNSWAPNSWYQTISADFHWEFGWKEESSMVFELLPSARITTAAHIATRKQKNLYKFQNMMS